MIIYCIKNLHAVLLRLVGLPVHAVCVPSAADLVGLIVPRICAADYLVYAIGSRT